MKKEYQEDLINRYSDFFRYLNQEGPIIPIQFGIECGDGWYWLLNNLMDSIYNYCKNNSINIPDVTQIKEKYGRLCFYYNGGDDLIDGMVWLAEDLSYKICESCGSSEHILHTKGWIRTICETCNKNRL